jgi:hypothetical protein
MPLRPEKRDPRDHADDVRGPERDRAEQNSAICHVSVRTWKARKYATVKPIASVIAQVMTAYLKVLRTPVGDRRGQQEFVIVELERRIDGEFRRPQKLTMTIMTIGSTRKNSRPAPAARQEPAGDRVGEAVRLARRRGCASACRDRWFGSSDIMFPKAPGRPAGRRGLSASGRDELVPLADHVLVFVHHRVPAGDRAHAVVERAAVAGFAGLGQDLSPNGLVMSPVASLPSNQ